MATGYPRRRNRLRYPGYDYAQPGAVFVTMCTHGRQPLFGTVDQGQMVHSPVGAMVLAGWRRIPETFPEIGLDACVVMPDHVHGVLFIGTEPKAGGESPTVGEIIRWLKSVTVRAYGDGVRAHGWTPYERHLWQGKFHDRIVRSEAELTAIRAYIEGNPGRWWERHGDNM